MKIHWERLLPTLLVWILSFLAGRYLGELYLAFFRAFTLLLAGNVITFILGWVGLRYNQHFSREHLNRGEKIGYRFYVQQSLPFGTGEVYLQFHRLQKGAHFHPEKMDLQLRGNKKEERNYSIQAMHRGVYESGFKGLTLKDYLGLWEIPVVFYPRNIYVYPKIYNQKGQTPRGLSQEGDREVQNRHGQDQTFRNLKEYRRGMDTRGISWKHFARLDRPVIQEQGINSTRERIILLDRRPIKREREDLLLENALACANLCRTNQNQVLIAGFTDDKILKIEEDKDWDSLIRGTLTLPFDAESLHNIPLPDAAPVTLITALQNQDILEKNFWLNRSNWQLMVLLEGLTPEERHPLDQNLEDLRKIGVEIITIEKGEDFWSDI